MCKICTHPNECKEQKNSITILENKLEQCRADLMYSQDQLQTQNVHVGDLTPPTSLAEITKEKAEEILRAACGDCQIFLPDTVFDIPTILDLKLAILEAAVYEMNYIPERLDCITGDTPVWIKINDDIKLIEVRELVPMGNYVRYNNVEIYTRLGFKQLVSASKKLTKKPVIRLLDSSDISMTTDHKLVCNPNMLDNKYVAAADVSREQLIKSVPVFKNGGIDNYELGWAHGYFCAEGSAYIREGQGYKGAMWSIRCGNTDHLERAAAAYAKVYPDFEFYINKYSSEEAGRWTNLGQRKMAIAQLLCSPRERHNDGVKGAFIRSFKDMFYSAHKVKKVPDMMMAASNITCQGFWDGVKAGDGSNDGVISSSKLETMGLVSMLQKLGVTPRVHNHKGFAVVQPSYQNGHYWGNRWVNAPDLTLRKREQKTNIVYDICTGVGEFIAGDIAVKNCDDFTRKLKGKMVCPGWSGVLALDVWFQHPRLGPHSQFLTLAFNGESHIAVYLIEGQVKSADAFELAIEMFENNPPWVIKQ